MKTTEIKRPTVDALDKAFTVVAFARLKKIKPGFTDTDVLRESARIERCVEYLYKIDKKIEFDYPAFACNFLKDNLQELISGNKYSGLYVDDVDDNVTEREYYMEEATFIM